MSYYGNNIIPQLGSRQYHNWLVVVCLAIPNSNNPNGLSNGEGDCVMCKVVFEYISRRDGDARKDIHTR